jgi:hypothetical protein
VIGAEVGVGGGGDHGGVVCGEGAAGEEGFEAGGFCALFEGGTELGVGGYSAGDEDAFGLELFGGGHGAVDKVADHRVLKFPYQSQRLRAAKGQQLVEFSFAAGEGGFPFENFLAVFAVFADVVENRGFEAAETEVERVAARFRGTEFDGGWRAVGGGCEAIEDRAARIAQSEEFGDFVVGFAGGVVAGLADFLVEEGAVRRMRRDFVEDGVAAGDDEADRGKFRSFVGFEGFEEDGLDVAFEMIYPDQRFA